MSDKGAAPAVQDVVGGQVPAPGQVWEATPKVAGQRPATRVYVPSVLADNPALIAKVRKRA